jgi:hypothetical protein
MIQFSKDRRKWNKVSRGNPCPVCGKPDWCLTTGPADSPDAVICARIESEKRIGTKGAGWLHRLRDDDGWRDRPRQRRVDLAAAPTRSEVFGALAKDYADTLANAGAVATDLGVTENSLRRLQIGYSYQHDAYSFPMKGQNREIVGIRLRRGDGRKLSVKGGREGLFIPEGVGPDCPFTDVGQLLICEGPTDTAALFDLGFNVVQRRRPPVVFRWRGVDRQLSFRLAPRRNGDHRRL